MTETVVVVALVACRCPFMAQPSHTWTTAHARMQLVCWPGYQAPSVPHFWLAGIASSTSARAQAAWLGKQGETPQWAKVKSTKLREVKASVVLLGSLATRATYFALVCCLALALR